MINDTFLYATAAADQALGLAVHVAALADEIDALHRVIRAAGDEPVRRTGFLCDIAIGSMRQASDELQDTADHLVRIASAMQPGGCPIPWGVCPEHGNTLVSSGRKTWCRVVGCGQTWDYDRVGLPCSEPARWLVTDQHGACSAMCDGHAHDACECLEGARIELREEFA
jgi:hypothetical protein